MSQAFPNLVEDIFPACQVHLIGGSRGAGKTALEVWMASHILKGQDFLGHKTNKPPAWGALILDRGDEDRLAWWKAAGIEPLPYYCLTKDKHMTPEALIAMTPAQCIRFLQQKLNELELPLGAVLTVDVANFFAGNSNLGYQSSFAHGWALTKIAADKQLTILALMHGGKQKGPDERYVRATDRIIAGTGFLGAVCTVSYLTTPEEVASPVKIQELSWEPHHHPAETFKLLRTEEGLFRLLELGDEFKLKAKEDVEYDDYLVFFPLVGSGAYVTTAEVIEKAIDLWNFAPITIKRAIARLEAEGKIVKFKDERGKWQKIAKVTWEFATKGLKTDPS